MAKPPKAYVLDRLLSLMNIISQANIYLILCACTQPRILPKTIGDKVHSVSEANTCFSHLLRGIQLKPSIHRRSLFHHFFKSCETNHFPYFTWAFQNPNHVKSCISSLPHYTLTPPFMWASSFQAIHMTLSIFKSCDLIPNRHLTWTRLKICHVKKQVKGLSHESPFKNVMWFP